jgi:hypothetical protein
MGDQPDTRVAGLNDIAGPQSRESGGYLAYAQLFEQAVFFTWREGHAAQVNGVLFSLFKPAFQRMAQFMQ